MPKQKQCKCELKSQRDDSSTTPRDAPLTETVTEQKTTILKPTLTLKNKNVNLSTAYGNTTSHAEAQTSTSLPLPYTTRTYITHTYLPIPLLSLG